MTNAIYFGKFLVTKQVFYQSKYSYALVNLKPLVPGHVLVVPLRRSVISLADLTVEENDDYFRTVQLIHKFIKVHYSADSLNIAIQDGPEAGQTVPHLHTHIIPRYRLNNIGDRIYNLLDEWTYEGWQSRREAYITAGGRNGRKQLAKPDDQRIARTEDEMVQEAEELREALSDFQKGDLKVS